MEIVSKKSSFLAAATTTTTCGSDSRQCVILRLKGGGGNGVNVTVWRTEAQKNENAQRCVVELVVIHLWRSGNGSVVGSEFDSLMVRYQARIIRQR